MTSLTRNPLVSVLNKRNRSSSPGSLIEITMSLEAIKYSKGNLEILDQLLLPHESKYIAVKNTEDGWSVIKNMQVPVLNE